MKSLPDQTIRVSHSAQRALDLFDAGLFLAWNARLERYEVWRQEVSDRGVNLGFVIRCSTPDGKYVDPSASWVMDQLRRRDSRFRDPKEAAREALASIHAQERADEEARQGRADEIHREIAEEYVPLWELKDDPHWTSKQYTRWDPEPVSFAVKTTPMREAIREAAA